MRDQARRARARAAFSALAERDKNIVLVIAEELAGRSRSLSQNSQSVQDGHRKEQGQKEALCIEKSGRE